MPLELLPQHEPSLIRHHSPVIIDSMYDSVLSVVAPVVSFNPHELLRV